jgi:hypothetical protein
MPDASVKIGLDSSEIDSKLAALHERVAQTGEGINRIGELIGVSFSAAGIVEATKSLVEFAVNIKHASDELDLSTDSYQGLVAAVQHGTGTAEDFEKAYGHLIQTVEKSRAGDVEATKSLNRLGVSWQEIKAMSVEEIFYKISDGVHDSTNKSRTFTDIVDVMGKTGKKLIPTLEQGAASLKKFADSVPKVSSQQIDEVEKLETRWNEAWRNMEVSALKTLFNIKDKLKDFDPIQFNPEFRAAQDARTNKDSIDEEAEFYRRHPHGKYGSYTNDGSVPSLEGTGPSVSSDQLAFARSDVMNDQPAYTPPTADGSGPLDDDPTHRLHNQTTLEIEKTQAEAERDSLDRAHKINSLLAERRRLLADNSKLDRSDTEQEKTYEANRKQIVELDRTIGQTEQDAAKAKLDLETRLHEMQLAAARETMTAENQVKSLEAEREERRTRIASLEKQGTKLAEDELATQRQKVAELDNEIRKRQIANFLKSPEEKASDAQRARDERRAANTIAARARQHAQEQAAGNNGVQGVDVFKRGHARATGEQFGPTPGEVRAGIDGRKDAVQAVTQMPVETMNVKVMNIDSIPSRGKK